MAIVSPSWKLSWLSPLDRYAYAACTRFPVPCDSHPLSTTAIDFGLDPLIPDDPFSTAGISLRKQYAIYFVTTYCGGSARAIIVWVHFLRFEIRKIWTHTFFCQIYKRASDRFHWKRPIRLIRPFEFIYSYIIRPLNHRISNLIMLIRSLHCCIKLDFFFFFLQIYRVCGLTVNNYNYRR